jgi:hypothetical protein
MIIFWVQGAGVGGVGGVHGISDGGLALFSEALGAMT